MIDRIIIPCVNLILDDTYLKEKEFVPFLKKILPSFHVQLIQLRIKKLTAHEFFDIAKELKMVCDQYKIHFIINDRVDIAIAVDASGVHVGHSDLPPNFVRKILGPDKIIGFSITSIEELKNLGENQVDYLGVGAIFPTITKGDASLLSLSILKEISSHTDIPIIAIGGINSSNAKLVMENGAHGVAVASYILNNPDPIKALEDLYHTLFN